METKKHHCMAVFKSDHFGAADLEEHLEQGGSPIFKILKVQQEYGVKVAGKKGNHNIAYFEGGYKPWVLNTTNTRQLRKFQGGQPMVEDWKPMIIELFVIQDAKSLDGGTTQGVRIRPVQPNVNKLKSAFTAVNFERALAVNATIEIIEKGYTIADDVKAEYLKQLKAKENATT